VIKLDYIAHFLWSSILFAGPQMYWAMLCGVLPDTIPFGSLMLRQLFRRNSADQQKRTYRDREAMMSYYQRPDTRWVYGLYNWTHSLVVWGILFIVLWFVGEANGFRPWFLLAGFLHILMDIPTHTHKFFAPRFLTPFSKFHVNGISWATPWVMVVNYSSIVLFLILRLLNYLPVIPWI